MDQTTKKYIQDQGLEFQPGDRCWVDHLTVRAADTGNGFEVKRTIREHEFYEVTRPTYAKGELRYVIGPIGKRQFQGTPAPYGMAYPPDRVFKTEAQAREHLNNKVQTLIAQLTAILQ